MEYIFIGKIVNTHGIKGELRIKSNFEFKNKVFKVGTNIYIGKDKVKEVIRSYRHHKEFDMVKLSDYNNINQVLPFLKEDVFANKDDLNLSHDEVLDSNLIGLNIYVDNNLIGTITEVFAPSKIQKVIRYTNSGKNYLIPYVKNFIKEIDLSNQKMVLYSMEGVLECD